jgi:hypothetical protein
MKGIPIGYDNTPDDSTCIWVDDNDTSYEPDNTGGGGGGGGGCLSVMLVIVATAASIMASSVFVLLNY